MTDTPPPTPPGPMPQPSRAMSEWAVGVIRSLSLNNILIIALLVIIAIPSYAAWRFLTDASFRKEFTGGGMELVDANAPCIIYKGKPAEDQERTFIIVGFAFTGRVEHIIGIRTAQRLTIEQIQELCQQVRKRADKATEVNHDLAEQQRKEREEKP